MIYFEINNFEYLQTSFKLSILLNSLELGLISRLLLSSLMDHIRLEICKYFPIFAAKYVEDKSTPFSNIIYIMGIAA